MSAADAAAGVVTIGETMALMSSRGYGPLPHSAGLDLGIGGAESNVAIGVQRLGIPATWVGKVGRDPLGDLVLREISAEGVRVRAVRDDDAPTALMVKERRTSSRTSVWYYRTGNAGSRLRADEVDLEAVRSAALLHVTGISLAVSETLADAVARAVAVARAEGVVVSFDLNFRRKLWSPETAAASYRSILPSCDVVFAGDDEARIALGAMASDDLQPLELAARLAEFGPAQSVIKLGERGATAIIDGARFERRAIPITPVDTVGAGDAFVAGYLAELVSGAPAEQRLDTAIRAGAYACLSEGDWEGLPRRAELADLDSDGVAR
ncbi:sugar kinase [Microbacterium sp. zg-Y818]|uniref:sugar kinase n=1 Tax=unclassified Microbacterium TaxID=2609290 RepID=UPI00214B8E98|nr:MULTISPECIES: sugar kinase [unclassified Microbacterium]MCR2800233.1 sugar kinase [Microbacterium sp. zg.Y818]WIM22199.1 sugar kinase [Microbacterium sp. zg-Y818]